MYKLSRLNMMSIIRVLPLVLLFTVTCLLYFMLVIREVDARNYQVTLTILSTGLLTSLIWINWLSWKSIGSLKKLSIRKIDYFSLIASVVFSYVLLLGLSPGDFSDFRFYYITLSLALFFYVLMSVEFVKKD